MFFQSQFPKKCLYKEVTKKSFLSSFVNTCPGANVIKLFSGVIYECS